ncbi:MAG: hypothetical protein ACTHOJ_01910 [Sphingomonas oligoaromativorans]
MIDWQGLMEAAASAGLVALLIVKVDSGKASLSGQIEKLEERLRQIEWDLHCDRLRRTDAEIMIDRIDRNVEQFANKDAHF